jgi:hypothetical protein
MLADDDVMLREEFLLPGHINEEVGIRLVEIVKGHPLHIAHGIRQRPLDARAAQARMREEDEDAFHDAEGTDARTFDASKTPAAADLLGRSCLLSKTRPMSKL